MDEDTVEAIIVWCDHCDRAALIEPHGASELILQFVGGKHRLTSEMPKHAIDSPRVFTGSDIYDVEFSGIE